MSHSVSKKSVRKYMKSVKRKIKKRKSLMKQAKRMMKKSKSMLKQAKSKKMSMRFSGVKGEDKGSHPRSSH